MLPGASVSASEEGNRPCTEGDASASRPRPMYGPLGRGSSTARLLATTRIPGTVPASRLAQGGDCLMPHCDSRVYNPVRMPAVCKALEE